MIEKLLTEAINSWDNEIKDIEETREWLNEEHDAHKKLTERIENKKKLIEDATKLMIKN